MKHRKHILAACALLFLFVCVTTVVPVVHASSPPDWIEQNIGVGGQMFAINDWGTFYGINARAWSEDKFGFEVGWSRWSESSTNWGVTYKKSWNIIPVSALHTLTHADFAGVYIRPYIGGGFNIASLSHSFSGSGVGQATETETALGLQGFAGAEVTFKAIPSLSFGGDFGIYRFGGDINRGPMTHVYIGSRFLVNYYLPLKVRF
jgi:hypothetical protein